MLAPVKLRDLALSEAPAPGRPLHLSAASGLVRVGPFLYVIADDELHLGVFPADGDAPGALLRLFDGALPDGRKKRKKRKPDLEALVLLPADAQYPFGALLALGSASRPNRRAGAILGLDAQGALQGAPRIVDLQPVLASLDAEFPALNIEGAIVSGGELRLFQRGTGPHPDNAMIRYSLVDARDALAGERAIAPLGVVRFDLGMAGGVPFGFTDAAALPGGEMIFTAIAENTDDAYNDGPCVAAAIGAATPGGELRWLRRLEWPLKIEGVDVRVDGPLLRLLLVSDADDPEIPAGLYSVSMSRP